MDEKSQMPALASVANILGSPGNTLQEIHPFAARQAGATGFCLQDRTQIGRPFWEGDSSGARRPDYCNLLDTAFHHSPDGW